MAFLIATPWEDRYGEDTRSILGAVSEASEVEVETGKLGSLAGPNDLISMIGDVVDWGILLKGFFAAFGVSFISRLAGHAADDLYKKKREILEWLKSGDQSAIKLMKLAQRLFATRDRYDPQDFVMTVGIRTNCSRRLHAGFKVTTSDAGELVMLMAVLEKYGESIRRYIETEYVRDDILVNFDAIPDTHSVVNLELESGLRPSLARSWRIPKAMMDDEIHRGREKVTFMR